MGKPESEWANGATGEGDLWREIAAGLELRRAMVAATVVRHRGSVPRRSGAKMLVLADGTTRGSVGGGLFEMLVIRDALEALKAGACVMRSYSFSPKEAAEGGEGVAGGFGAVCGGQAEVFLEVIMPPDRLLVVGGGHCGRALAQAAGLLGFAIVVADDREEYARPEDFAGVERVLHLPADYRGLPEPDGQTYVVLMTKGFITDEAALRQVIDSPAAYIGMIGSRQKRDVVLGNLKAGGVTEEKLARVRSPIGLEIGAQTPGEIAVSILAEIVQVRAARQTASPTGNDGCAGTIHASD